MLNKRLFLVTLVWCNICILGKFANVCTLHTNPCDLEHVISSLYVLHTWLWLWQQSTRNKHAMHAYINTHTHTLLTCSPHHTLIHTDLTHAIWYELAYQHTKHTDWTQRFFSAPWNHIWLWSQRKLIKESLLYPVIVSVCLYLVHGFFWFDYQHMETLPWPRRSQPHIISDWTQKLCKKKWPWALKPTNWLLFHQTCQ